MTALGLYFYLFIYLFKYVRVHRLWCYQILKVLNNLLLSGTSRHRYFVEGNGHYELLYQ